MIPRSQSEFHVFDFGTLIQVEIRNSKNRPVNISTATSIVIFFLRPDGSGFARTAHLGTSDMIFELTGMMGADPAGGPDPGVEGIAFYILQQGDLDMAGNWFLHVFTAFGSSGAWYSSVASFVVFPNLVSPVTVLSP